MDRNFKQRVKEKVGIMVAVSTLTFSVIGIFSLTEYITLYGCFAVFFVLFGMYKYA